MGRWPTERCPSCLSYSSLDGFTEKGICTRCAADPMVCSYCGAWSKRRENGWCFDCDFWLEKVRWITTRSKEVVRVKHVHYIIGTEADTGSFRGFGGARFDIKFNDGRLITSTNVWCQGDIPEKFWGQLPDNAVFLSPEELRGLAESVIDGRT